MFLCMAGYARQQEPANVLQLSATAWKADSIFTLTTVWTVPFPAGVGSALKTIPHPFNIENLIACNTDRGICIFSPEQRRIRWFRPGFRIVTRSIASKTLVADSGGILFGLEPADGKKRWRTKLRSEDYHYVANTEILVAVSARLSRVAVDLNNGEIIWRDSTADTNCTATDTFIPEMNWRNIDGIEPSGHLSAVAAAENRFAFGTKGGTVYMFSLSSGSLLWCRNIDGPANGPVVFCDNHLFIGSSRGRIYRFRASDGIGGIAVRADTTLDIFHLESAGKSLFGFAGTGTIFKIDAHTLFSHWCITSGFGGCGIDSVKALCIAGKRLWKLPNSPVIGDFFAGLDTSNVNNSVVYFRKEPPCNLIEAPAGKNSQLWQRYRKNPLLEHREHLILVDGTKVSGYIPIARPPIPPSDLEKP